MREEVFIKEFVSWLTHRLETDLLVARQGIQPREESALVVVVSLPELKPKFYSPCVSANFGGDFMSF